MAKNMVNIGTEDQQPHMTKNPVMNGVIYNINITIKVVIQTIPRCAVGTVGGESDENVRTDHGNGFGNKAKCDCMLATMADRPNCDIIAICCWGSDDGCML